MGIGIIQSVQSSDRSNVLSCERDDKDDKKNKRIKKQTFPKKATTESIDSVENLPIRYLLIPI